MTQNSISDLARRLSGNNEAPLVDNTEQVRGATPIPENTGNRAPDKWVVNDAGVKVPVWLNKEDLKPWWQSKIFITQALSLAFTMAALFGDFDVAPETQQLIIGMALTVASGGSIVTAIFRLFATDKKLVK